MKDAPGLGFRGATHPPQDVRRLLLLVALGGLAGCFGGGPPECAGCAVPTDAPATCPNCTTPPPTPPDLTDPGLVIEGTWRVGDGWDYVSNQSHYRDVRVLEERTVNGTRFLRVREFTGIVGNPPQIRTDTWLDASAWARVNVSFVGGSRFVTFEPGDPQLRYVRNGSYAYNETSTSRANDSSRAIVRVNVHYLGEDPVDLPWGVAMGGTVEYRALRSESGGSLVRELTVRHVSSEWQNDLLTLTPSSELFELRHARVGDKTLSILDDV